MSKSTAVAAVETKSQLPADLDLMAEFQQDSGQGTDNFKSSDLSIPFVSILQDTSPQCKKREGSYVQGAEAGMFFNSATEELWSEIIMVPAAYEMRAAEWTPRSKGGGLVRDYGVDIETAKARIKGKDPVNGHDITENGTEIVIAGTHYVLLVNETTGIFTPAVIALTSTQLRKSRKWNTLQSQLSFTGPNGKPFRPPSFAMSYKATSASESNEKGSWMGWVIKQHKIVTELPNGGDIYHAAKEFRRSVTAGEAKLSPTQETTAVSDDIPF